MRYIDISNPHRQKHFDFFRQMAMPHFNMVAPVPVRILTEFVRDHRLHFSGTIIYLIAKTANAIVEFRWRIRGDKIAEHEVVHPSYTVPTDTADVFSFCYVDYVPEYATFIESVKKAQSNMRSTPSLEDEPGRDDYLFMSAIPWVHFTGFAHAMHIPSGDSVPRFVWGRIDDLHGDTLMPLGVQAHHAVVDGRHMGMFFERFAEFCNAPQESIDLHT